VVQYGIKLVCSALGLSESSYYYEPRQRSDATAFASELRKQAGKHPTEGYRHLAGRMRRIGRWCKTSPGRVQRWMRRLGLIRKKRRKPKRTTNSQHSFKRYKNLVKHLKIRRPNHVWVCDITWIVLADGDNVYLAIVMDVYTRKIIGWELGRDLTQQLTIAALKRALRHGTPRIHHSDQGVQYAAGDYTQMLLDRKVRISMAAVGKAWENGYAERVIGTIKIDEVELTEYTDYADARRQLGKFIDDTYNRKRIHSSLGYLTPDEFEAQWREQNAKSPR
jgi:transposase InsO family protein